MEITRIRTKKGCWGMPQATSLSEVAEAMKSARYELAAKRIAQRATMARIDQEGKQRQPLKGSDALPYLIFSSLFSRQGVHDFQKPTGLMLLSIDTGTDGKKTALLRHRAEQVPQTLMAFRGVSGRTLKIVVRCQLAKRQLPTNADEYTDFLSHAQQQAANYYEAMIKCKIARGKETLLRGCRMSHDTQLYFNPQAQPLTVVGMAGGALADYPLAETDEQGNTSEHTAEYCTEREQADFYTCLKKAQETVGDNNGNPLQAERLIVELAHLCRKSAVPEESAVERTMLYRQYAVREDIVRKIFHTVYQNEPEGQPWSQMTEKERIARKVQEFFERRYELRYNTMKGIEEFRQKGADYHPWKPLTERDIRRIGHEQMLDSGAAWPIDIENYAHSSLSHDYNPIHEFLAGCGRWDQRHNYIEQMAQRVPCKFPEWKRLFHRWFLGMVAGWLGCNRDFGNAVVPMLIGSQGVRKTTFCKLLMPHSLREYYIDDIKMNNPDQIERMLARMALVNIDEYNAKTEREQAKIKRLLTERDVQIRRMRSDQYYNTQRMSSFIATTNERQPLTDTTGSRRYLCVAVTGTIDTDTPVNYQQLYAQALWEIDHGEPYYMSREEETVMQEHNQQFIATSAAEILLTAYYEPAPRSKQYFVRATDMLNDLQSHIKGSDRPNMTRLLKALKAAHFEHGAMKGTRGWYARKK